MPDTKAPTTELTSQYAAQVAGDLERNAKEQERLSTEIVVLQEQLLALQHDHTVLTNVQEALGAAGTATQLGVEEAAAPSVPQQKTGTEPRTGKRVRGKKAAAGQESKAVKKTPTKATVEKAAQPTLVELIRRHLIEQGEPRSAAEVADALGQVHPDRAIKTTVVRTTLENLVARSQTQRSKQGSSVFYSATDAVQPTPPAAPQADPEADPQATTD